MLVYMQGNIIPCPYPGAPYVVGYEDPITLRSNFTSLPHWRHDNIFSGALSLGNGLIQ